MVLAGLELRDPMGLKVCANTVLAGQKQLY